MPRACLASKARCGLTRLLLRVSDVSAHGSTRQMKAKHNHAHLPGPHRGHDNMCNPGRSCWQQAALYGLGCLSPPGTGWPRGSPGTRAVTRQSRLDQSQPDVTLERQAALRIVARRRTKDEEVLLRQPLAAGHRVQHGAPHVFLLLAISAVGPRAHGCSGVGRDPVCICRHL